SYRRRQSRIHLGPVRLRRHLHRPFGELSIARGSSVRAAQTSRAARAGRFPMTAPDSVLVLRFSALGDVILTSPAIDALHSAWPKTKILYAVKSPFAHLVQHNPNIHQVVGLEPREGIVSFHNRLRALHYGALLDLHA